MPLLSLASEGSSEVSPGTILGIGINHSNGKPTAKGSDCAEIVILQSLSRVEFDRVRCIYIFTSKPSHGPHNRKMYSGIEVGVNAQASSPKIPGTGTKYVVGIKTGLKTKLDDEK